MFASLFCDILIVILGRSGGVTSPVSPNTLDSYGVSGYNVLSGDWDFLGGSRCPSTECAAFVLPNATAADTVDVRNILTRISRSAIVGVRIS